MSSFVQDSIGIIPMAAKPFHKGHEHIIEIASRENESVIVYVSTGNRVKPGEFPMTWEKMRRAWENLILPALPHNVSVHYVANPVTATYEKIKSANAAGHPAIKLYADPADASDRFRPAYIQKHGGELLSNGMIEVKDISREETGGISGTEMRRALMNDDFESFKSGTPPSIDPVAYWKLLRS